MYRLPQKLAAEFIGTFAVVVIASGAVCVEQSFRASDQLGMGLLGVALAYGLAFAVMVTAVAHISGGHLNPAVTIGFWVTKRLSTLQSVLYAVAQLLGAGAAGYFLVAIVPEATWRPVALGTPDLVGDFTRWHGMLLEAVLTFLVVFVFFATIVDAKGALSKVAGFAVGLTVSVGVLFGGPFTGGAMNPARVFGPALAARHFQNHGVFWVGPLFGGVVAGVVYDRLFLRDQPPL
ncbi:MAG TPA: aquaporin [Candidatus Limnocylindrales bacterium]|nr:aquaporin [Candidatus Limnocylindrales bacterium]